ncbi:hypothetical protein HBI25_015890 [Parastagonospora nodorum]|nr:hypothetical protein HBH53_019520 [Parastagonospora nodorum]KAH3977501.1 hypothetical protein HBH52_113930 [Parastagonospora nodorum]KAH4000045.1 hypothetical protein HBI10_107830 [Parastagonospora nodorum]KAH4022339.1 hypothetical protein HBI13_101360 [Parastagonospora nodorum]KAH4027653.1 hypothetical protein HBI09_141460 [Parastagonospora nodorum]
MKKKISTRVRIFKACPQVLPHQPRPFLARPFADMQAGRHQRQGTGDRSRHSLMGSACRQQNIVSTLRS